MPVPAIYKLQQQKTMANRSESVAIPCSFDPLKTFHWLEQKGKELYGPHFRIHEDDHEILFRLVVYFLRDEQAAPAVGIHLHKGILLSGPVGCGKTTLMTIMRQLLPAQGRFIMKSCRQISFEFIRDGYETISRYSRFTPGKDEKIEYCFDDLGTEQNLKYYGNECNVLAEILLSRYDLFVNFQLKTHVTTNLAASELEQAYGNRVRSRLREMFNLIHFSQHAKDKRQ